MTKLLFVHLGISTTFDGIKEKAMTAREFRKFKEKNKLNVKEIADILMQSEESVYAKLKGTRTINTRDFFMIEKYISNPSKKQPA